MSKPSLLYASPFPPIKSGISDYSVVLVKALAKDFDITLYTDDYVISEPSLEGFPVLKYGADHVQFDAFDYRIYNMGNQPYYHSYIYEAALEHPGMVILHDLSLYYLFIGYHQNKGMLYSSLYQTSGLDNFLEIKEIVKKHPGDLLTYKKAADRLPLNRELLASNNLFMVHSEYVRNQILATGLKRDNEVHTISMIAQIDRQEELVSREELFAKYGIPEDALIIASFGYIAETKLNRETIHAVTRLSGKQKNKICYVMVGDGFYVDDLLEEDKIIKTGYTQLEEFNSFLTYADIVVNLRNPTLGETSAAMLRALQMGKPIITNNGGWFSEIPDDCVYKVELTNVEAGIEKAIKCLLEDDRKRKTLSQKAKQYVDKRCSAKVVTHAIENYLHNQSHP